MGGGVPGVVLYFLRNKEQYLKHGITTFMKITFYLPVNFLQQ